MTEVIRRVVDDTRRECEGLLRTWAFNKNGAAGCFIIKEEVCLDFLFEIEVIVWRTSGLQFKEAVKKTIESGDAYNLEAVSKK